ncbi:MAG: 1,4-dihydroxy-2-naphthoate polyprenyltransferase [Saprospiraceae bacterium]|nr:1,4-dihydroxy-2-naphthoate polyprenyltransferase [Saprospiraceae bacterium]
MPSIRAWLVAFRLHTLPLALSTILMGSLLAAYHHDFHPAVLVWAMLTTLFLQILSNLANDYGDTVHGVDNNERIGPKRSLQKGEISLRQMGIAIIIFIALALVSGIYLIIESMRELQFTYSALYFILGIGAIIAAVKYTIGSNPYGYSGLGDLFVFIFFGLVGVMGTYFLHTHYHNWSIILPAISIGCFSTGVLNLNNLRDRINDEKSGKSTLVVKIGLKNAKIYHAILLSTGMLTAILFTLQCDTTFLKWIYLISFAGIIRSIVVVLKNTKPEQLYPELKYLSLSTLLFSILYGMGLNF